MGDVFGPSSPDCFSCEQVNTARIVVGDHTVRRHFVGVSIWWGDGLRLQS
jgi:hypothetical protein